MNDSSQHMDVVDLLLAAGVFALFIVFGVCMWVLKREMNKKKAANQKEVNK